mgnify:FL=1
MILTKSEILAQIAAGNIVILGCTADSLEDSALDVTMAPVLLEVAENEVDLKKPIRFIKYVIDSDGFTLHPNRFYLGVTNEFTYTPKHKPFYNGRSSCGRSGLASHITAGTGDIGFSGHWTLELFVFIPTIVYPNMPIGQIVFHEVKGLISDTYDKKEVNYNNLFSEKPEPVKPNLYQKIK